MRSQALYSRVLPPTRGRQRGITQEGHVVSEKTVMKLAQKWQDVFGLGAWQIEVACVPEATIGRLEDDEEWGSMDWGNGCVEVDGNNQWAVITVATKQPLHIVDETLCHEHTHLAIESAIHAVVERAIRVTTAALMKTQT